MIEATVAAAFFVACLDPPNRNVEGEAGSSGLGTGGGAAAKGGTGAVPNTGGASGSGTAANGGTGAKGGSGAKGGTGAKGGSSTGARGGSTSTGATGGTDTGGTDTGATGGTGAETGEGGAAGALGGEGGVGAAAGDGAAGETTNPPNVCDTVVVGGSSIYPTPGAGGVAKPSGTPGNLKVLNWAGYTGAVTFTFDDNPNSQVAAYASLAAVGVRMTFYLVCSADGNNSVWTTAAAAGHELGNHTMHHCMADGTSGCWGAYLGVDQEIDMCTQHIKDKFGVPDVYTMASPMGDSNWDVPASARFLANRGVSDNPGGVKPNDSTNAFELPCHIAAEGETATGTSGFNAVTNSVVTNGSWRIILNHSLGNNDGYHPVDPAEVIAAMTYARDLGTVWVDSLVNVAAYWRAQKAVSTAQPVVSGGNITYSWTLPEHFPPGHYLRVKVDGGTVSQCGTELAWNEHGYYEIALDAGSLTISP